METFGWVPTLYMPSERTFKSRATGAEFTRFGSWRNGGAEADALSVFCADVDNSDTARPIVAMQTVASALDGLGCSYFMYTTFSHTAEKPKFRVVIDTDRDLTRRDAARRGLAELDGARATGRPLDLRPWRLHLRAPVLGDGD